MDRKKKVAENICQVMGISPRKTDLVMLIGQGDENSNIAATVNWVEEYEALRGLVQESDQFIDATQEFAVALERKMGSIADF